MAELTIGLDVENIGPHVKIIIFSKFVGQIEVLKGNI